MAPAIRITAESTRRVAAQGLPAPFAVALYIGERYIGHFTNAHSARDYAEGHGHERTRRIRRQP